jgi:hypothetical protein
MAEEPQTSPRLESAPGEQILDYDRPGAKPARSVPISGVVSLVVILLQFLGESIFLYFADRMPPVAVPQPEGGIIYGLILLFAPFSILLSLVLGCYSIYRAGISLRNICGVIATCLVIAEVFLILWKFLLSQDLAGFDNLLIPVLVCIVAVMMVIGWLLDSRRR